MVQSMKEYIDRVELNKTFDMVCSNEVLRKQIGQYIDSAPSEDVKEVVHAEWEIGFMGRMCRCSHCKEEFDYEHNDITHDWYYCPVCGSDMGLGGTNE